MYFSGQLILKGADFSSVFWREVCFMKLCSFMNQDHKNLGKKNRFVLIFYLNEKTLYKMANLKENIS